jgi:hypothetical protein
MGRHIHKTKEFYDLYSSPSIVGSDKIGKHELGKACSTHAKIKKLSVVFIGKPNKIKHSRDLDIHEKIFKWISYKYGTST